MTNSNRPNLTLKVKRFDTSLPLPAKHTGGAACFDLCARVDTTIAAHSLGYIPLNVAVEPPEGYWLMIAPRSSTHKYGLIPGNGVGIGDQDFCGDKDEYCLIVYNVTDKPVKITKATRIAQMMILPNLNPEIVEVETLNNPTRGGLGSTGTH